jgi:hypothetical protein
MNPIQSGIQKPEAPDVASLRHYYVLQAGFIAGPFTQEQLLTHTLQRTFGRDDVVQIAGRADWMPLGAALDSAGASEVKAAPEWQVILRWAWIRLRYNLDERSLRAGLVLTGISTLFVIASRVRGALWMPWLVLACAAGIALLRQKKQALAALVILASAAAAWGLWNLRL